MPELPEVETIRKGLEQSVMGATFRAVAVHGRRSIRRQSAQAFIDALIGRSFSSANRRGKYLALGLNDGAFLVVHLGMSGRLVLVCDPEVASLSHTHVTFSFLDGRELAFIDPRTFGELFVTHDLGANGLPETLEALGPDPLLEEISGADLHAMFTKRHTSLKALFLDQHAIAGIGSLYADEICFCASIRPDRRTDDLGPKACEALSVGIQEVLRDALAHSGSSLADEGYRDVFGRLGSYQDHHFVYGRAGLPCRHCGTTISLTRVAGRSAHFCPTCQA